MSFYTSLSGINNAQIELSTISNNLANAQTTGFKQSSTNFADIVAGSAYTNPKLIEGAGSTVTSIEQNFTQGSLQQTGSGLDMAINGQGFFTLKDPVTGQVSYTRNGNFSMDSSGNITSPQNTVLQVFPVNASGTATSTTAVNANVPQADTSGSPLEGTALESNGVLTASYADGTVSNIGMLAMASFPSQTGLRQIGDQTWYATGDSGVASLAAPAVNGNGNVISGELENSNVDVSTQLVDLINAQQYFQSNAKAISTYSQLTTGLIQQQG